eukprot:8359723-Pyramimonas_sp.AAC.1
MAKAKGSIATLKSTSWGSLEQGLEYSNGSASVAPVQGHHRTGSGLGSLQQQFRDWVRWRLVWCSYPQNSNLGATGGAAILARTAIPITSPPFF